MLKTILWGGEILEDWKIKIAVLWIVLEFCIITVSMLSIHVVIQSIPEEMIAETTPEEIMAVVITLLIPPIMAFLSLTLKDKANRWLNIIVAIVFIVLFPFGSVGFPTEVMPSLILTGIVEIVALALIVWYAWKSKQKA